MFSTAGQASRTTVWATQGYEKGTTKHVKGTTMTAGQTEVGARPSGDGSASARRAVGFDNEKYLKDQSAAIL